MPSLPSLIFPFLPTFFRFKVPCSFQHRFLIFSLCLTSFSPRCASIPSLTFPLPSLCLKVPSSFLHPFPSFYLSLTSFSPHYTPLSLSYVLLFFLSYIFFCLKVPSSFLHPFLAFFCCLTSFFPHCTLPSLSYVLSFFLPFLPQSRF